jgi:predicted TIM-barrel fold metal-dependent hydrolase
MIDSHFHLWTADTSTPAKRTERAEQVRAIADEFGVERICLIGERGDSVSECREHNRTVARMTEEHPDLFYGWARASPLWGEAGVREFRRAVEEDGLVGLKLYAQTFLDAPAVDPLAEAAVDMGVPVISHVAHRPGNERRDDKPKESDSDNVRALAERFPKLQLISGHIGGGGLWEYRIKNLQDVENVYLDTSGSVCDAGQLEMAADHLGVDRLVYGTDTWFLPGIGKLQGADLTPEQKADIAYNMASLIPDSTPNKLDPEAVEAGIDRARDLFAEFEGPREETIVDANAYVGNFPWTQLDASAPDVLEVMDSEGIDRAVVSSFDAVFYRNPHPGNRELADEIAGHEDRLIPFATLDPTYPAWEDDLAECIEDLGMRGVRLFPLYHDYAVDDPAVIDLMDACAEYGVPVMFVGLLEDKRQHHSNWRHRDYDDIGSKTWSGDQADALVDVLQASPEVDVVVANAWTHAERIVRDIETSYPSGVRLNNATRSGETYVVLDDLYMFFPYQGEEIVESVGADRLVTGSKLPLLNVQSHYVYTEQLPVSERDRDRVRSENVLSLLDESP